MESIVELTGRKKMMKKKEKMDIMMGLIDSMDDAYWEILSLSGQWERERHTFRMI